ncbi:MAG: hypothetical protein Kow0059_09200 [Candidatus Sumerlaeia bacterium]
MHFQDFIKWLDDYRTGDLPPEQASMMEEFLFDHPEARQLLDEDEALGTLLRQTLTDYPTISQVRLRAVANRAIALARTAPDEAVAIPNPEATGRPGKLLEWLLGPLRQPRFALGVAAVFAAGALVGWTSKFLIPSSVPATQTIAQSSTTVSPRTADPSHAASATAALPDDTGSTVQPVSVINKSALLEPLQSVKYDLLASGNAQQWRRLKEVENEWLRLMPAAAPAADTSDLALHHYQAGEAALLDNDAAQARRHFQAVLASNAQGVLAFLSTLQLANIAFDTDQDYPQALRYYQSSLNDFPPQIISDDNKVFIQKRIELITRNAMDDYRPLRLYTQARQSRADQAREYFVKLMTEYPNSPVAVEAVDQLLHYALDYPDKSLFPADQALQMFLVFVEKYPTSRLVSRVKVAMGDIYLFRYQRVQQAMLVYTSALELPHDPAVEQIVRNRIRFITDNGMLND